MTTTKPERELYALLTAVGIPYEPQGQVAGHRVDALVAGRHGPIAVEANGEWWHSKPKIVACDRLKLERMAAAGVCVVAAWDWRISRQPGLVVAAVAHAIDTHVSLLSDYAPVPKVTPT